MTAEEKDTKILEIGELVTEISRTNQILLDIFRAGGVANSDLSVLKAELQNWCISQIADCAKINGENNFTQKNFFETDKITVKSSRNVYSTTSSTTYSDGLLRYISSDSTYIGGVSFVNEPNFQDIYFRIYPVKSDGTRNSSTLGVLTLSYEKQYDLFYAKCPTLDWATWTSDFGIVNVSSLKNSNAPIVHKAGAEEISGVKTFLSSVMMKRLKNANYFASFATVISDLAKGDSLTNVDFVVLPSIVMHNNTDKTCRISATATSYHDSTKTVTTSILLYDIFSSTNMASIAELSLTKVQDESFCTCNINTDKTRVKGIFPWTTNTYNLGDGDHLWKNIYASSGSINVSDERLKEQIIDIPDNVLRAWGKVEFKQFKMSDSVKNKGISARIHIGVIAQRIKEAFESEGLDATKYGLFCWDKWEDEYINEKIIDEPATTKKVKVIDLEAVHDDNGLIIEPEKWHFEDEEVPEKYHFEKKLLHKAGDQYSVRYEECLALECAYQRWRLDQIEARLLK